MPQPSEGWLPGSPPGTSHRDLALRGPPMSPSSLGFTAWGQKGSSAR